MSSLSAEPPTAIDPERLEKLVALFHLRWNVPLLAQLMQNPAFGRVAVLAQRLDVGRSTVRRTLLSLVDARLVQPNPGYGHPLRPEFVLTDLGAELAVWCAQFSSSIQRRPDLERVAFQKWSMVVLLLVTIDYKRFSELEATLPAITARALAQCLRQLESAGLVQRDVADTYPVRVQYSPTPRGRKLGVVVAAFLA